MKYIFPPPIAVLIALPAAAESLASFEWPPQPPAAARDLISRLNGDWIIVIKAAEGDTVTHHMPLTAIANENTVSAAHNRGEYRYTCTATLPTGARIECQELSGQTSWRFIGTIASPHRYDDTLITSDDADNLPAMMVKVY